MSGTEFRRELRLRITLEVLGRFILITTKNGQPVRDGHFTDSSQEDRGRFF